MSRWSVATGISPRMDSVNNLFSTSVTREDGITTMSFVRALDTRDSTDDVDLTTEQFFIYGWGGTIDYSSGAIGQHPQTPIVSTDKINLPTTCTG